MTGEQNERLDEIQKLDTLKKHVNYNHVMQKYLPYILLTSLSGIVHLHCTWRN